MSLKSDLKNGKKIISIYGLGNVGGPITAAWLKQDAKVIGVDISQNLLNAIEKGQSHKKEPFISKIFSKYLKNGNFKLSSDGESTSKKSSIKFIAVPVGLKRKKLILLHYFLRQPQFQKV